MFGARLALASRYVELLAGAGIERGLIGPREVPRLWGRHLVNCALLAPLVPGPRVADVGSGAGLPGIVLAIQRPELEVVLVESMARRTQFLAEVCEELGMTDRVRVVRGRAEDPETRRSVAAVDCVTARAVAPLDRLVRWTMPLLRPGGELLALKGESAAEELASTPGVRGEVIEVSDGGARTWVVRVTKPVTRGKAR